MPSPPIQVFLTTIATQPALRQRQEYVLRVLQVKKVQFTSYDLASDEDAKKLWRRKAPLEKQQLPGILIGGEFPGTFQEFEEAVEFGELDAFLRLNEEWAPFEDDRPLLRAVPVGIPGAYTPAQMNPGHVSPLPSPIRTKPREGALDAGDTLGDSGLHGVDVTEDDLLALVEELGLGEKDANDLVKGLGRSATPPPKPEPKSEAVQSEQAEPTTGPVKESTGEPTKEPTAEPSKASESATADEAQATAKPVDTSAPVAAAKQAKDTQQAEQPQEASKTAETKEAPVADASSKKLETNTTEGKQDA
ncbi:hypothetical protein BD413DRAFT_510339 [Trametes elegans]|nr:hypothetical protein BD413DRAFT_510339 [Trametes elegans]